MIAMLILFVILGALIYYQVFTQGIFSCFIMMIWTLIAAIVALNFQDYLAMLMIDNGFAFFPKAVSLMVPFIIVLFGLRALTDSFIRGNMKFPDMIDRAGSFVFSLVSSLIIVGMISIGIQSLPLPESILGYQRINEIDKLDQQSTFWPAGDKFVVGIMDMASSFGFAGNMSFAHNHPDYLRELYLNRVVPMGHEGSTQYAPSGSIAITSVKVLDSSIPLVKIGSGNQASNQVQSAGVLEKGSGDLVSVKINFNTRPSGSDSVSCKDVDGNVRFAISHFRLYGHAPGKGTIESYPATIIGSDGRAEALTLSDGKAYTNPEELVLVFQWPASARSVAPQYLVFKNTCKVKIPAIDAPEEKEATNASEDF